MDEKSLFADFWAKESVTTLKVLSRIPEGSDYRPDPKSRTAREIAWQIVVEERMIIEALETAAVTWAPQPPPPTMRAICEVYERQSADIAHRRGQITTYLRPMGSTVPQVYGPSADEP